MSKNWRGSGPETHLSKEGKATKRLNRLSVKHGQCEPQSDDVIIEAPLVIWLRQPDPDTGFNEKHWFSTMRTPGNDRELVVGMLLSEGVVESVSQLKSLNFGKGDEHNECYAELALDVQIDWSSQGRSMSFSSCGLCGKSVIRLLELQGVSTLDNTSGWLSDKVVLTLPEALKAQQRIFALTGASHACGLFDAEGNLLAIAEDVGRHNALDKLLGKRAIEPKNMARRQIIGLSGRVSIEMMQKMVVVGVSVVVAVGAPTQLAVQLARRFGITLIGFCQSEAFNLYCGEHRLSID